MRNVKKYRQGFALPTVLIASVVMLTVLTVAVSSVSAVRTTLMNQYYEQMAKTAGEAGVSYAKACLAKNGNVPLWSDAKPLTPVTDCAGNEVLQPSVKVLVVGGGGGGASAGAGGGAGGYVYDENYNISVTSYSVVVGAGGAGGAGGGGNNGVHGNNSSFATLTAVGGGRGNSHGQGTTVDSDGGSGGGGAIITAGAIQLGGIGSQGNNGGQGMVNAGWTGNSGGGGGAGSAGGAAGNTAGTANGGDGLANTITGGVVYYAGGGGGGEIYGSYVGKGGNGGGGSGQLNNVGTAGTPNTGGGGGGGSFNPSTYYAGGSGGSGVVIIAYPNNGTITATGGTVTVSGLYKIHTFNSSGTFQVSAVSSADCPSDPRCSVSIDGNARSSFKVGMPTLDSDGHAIAIPNNGYTELIRTSGGGVWKTYYQPTVQAAVVPEVCSGVATSDLGWSSAQLASTQASLPYASGAKSIGISSSAVPAGSVYFHRNFMVQQAGDYNVSISTSASGVSASLYIDGDLVVVADGSLMSGTKSLSFGCHVVNVILTNSLSDAMATANSNFIAAIQQNNSTLPVVATDTAWRVSSGGIVDFSDPNYYADPSIWSTVYDYNSALRLKSTWTTTTSDAFSRMITSNHSGCNSANCPANSYSFYRNSRDFILSSSSQVRFSALCDDNCAVYVDGTMVISSAAWSNISQATITLGAGPHRVAAKVSNGSAGQSGFAVSVYNVTTSTVIDRTDSRWLAANKWYSGSTTDIPLSYADNYTPSPFAVSYPTTFDVLVVAGGGGGGGNGPTAGGAGGGGGGGVIYTEGVNAEVGSYSISVGSGGTAGVGGASRTSGGQGGSSVFGSLFTAIGGGGGAAQLGTAGGSGGSGGGGSGGGTPAPGAGGAGTAGQGSNGGAGITSPYGGGGGGGASGWGLPALASGSLSGDGGTGFISYLDGSIKIYGGGGGGGTYSTNTAGIGDESSGNGVNQNTNNGNGYPGTTNRGGGGGGANGLNKGGGGGAGGSGVVIVRYKTGSLTATGGTISSVTINGVSYTIHTFSSVGSSVFTITSIN